MKSTFIALVGTGLVSFQASSQIPLSKGTYTQNFDSLSSVTNHSWVNNETLPGWYVSRVGGEGAPNYKSYRVSDGSMENGWIYSFGSGTNRGVHPASDRALGTICSGTPQRIAFGARFVNDTSNVLAHFTVSYTGEQWRNGSTEAPQKFVFSYRISAAPITNSEVGVDIHWQRFPALNFVSPRTGLGMFAMDGNDPGNRTVFSRVPLTGVILKPAEELFLRWTVIDIPRPADGLAVDDVRLDFTAAAKE